MPNNRKTENTGKKESTVKDGSLPDPYKTNKDKTS
jgi:hypothetical protein